MQQAASQTAPQLRQDYLIIGACWLKLSYELSDQLVHKRSDTGDGRAALDKSAQARNPMPPFDF